MPLNLTVITTGSQASISWTGSAAWYQIEIIDASTLQTIAASTIGTTSYTISLPYGSYNARVRSECSSTFSTWTSYIYFNINNAYNCNVPTYLTASINGSQASISWSGSAPWYQIEIINTSNNQTVASATVSSSPYVVTLASGSYKVRVRSECSSTFSVWTDYIYFNVNLSTCYLPTNLSASINGSQASVSWSGSAPWYQIEIINTNNNQTVSSATIASSPYVVTLASGSYKVRVRSECSSTFSVWTDYIYFDINLSSCYLPTNLSASINGSQASISWTGSASWYQIEIINTSNNQTVASATVASSP